MLVTGKKKMQVLLKDEKTINQKNDKTYIENCKKLYENITKAENNNSFEQIFLDKKFITEKLHIKNHSTCGMKKTDSDVITEKRICRCMFHYGKDKEKCLVCPLKYKYKNISNKYEIKDAEQPTKRVIKTCGGIDLIFEDKEGNKKTYAVEVKPSYNTESIVRMITEIYTYTIEFPEYIKAIAFFEGSPQEREYLKYQNNEYFKNIINKVTVFKFVETENNNGVINFDIVKLEPNE